MKSLLVSPSVTTLLFFLLYELIFKKKQNVSVRYSGNYPVNCTSSIERESPRRAFSCREINVVCRTMPDLSGHLWSKCYRNWRGYVLWSIACVHGYNNYAITAVQWSLSDIVDNERMKQPWICMAPFEVFVVRGLCLIVECAALISLYSLSAKRNQCNSWNIDFRKSPMNKWNTTLSVLQLDTLNATADIESDKHSPRLYVPDLLCHRMQHTWRERTQWDVERTNIMLTLLISLLSLCCLNDIRWLFSHRSCSTSVPFGAFELMTILLWSSCCVTLQQGKWLPHWSFFDVLLETPVFILKEDDCNPSSSHNVTVTRVSEWILSRM